MTRVCDYFSHVTQLNSQLGRNSHRLLAARPRDLAQVLTSDDTRAWHKGRDEPPRSQSQERSFWQHDWQAERLALHTCPPSNMEITALTRDCCIFHEQTVYSTSSYFKMGYKYKCCTTIAQKTCFFPSLSPGENEVDTETQLQ